MAIILDFPKREAFLDKIEKELPPEIAGCATKVYEEALAKSRQAPSLEVRIKKDEEETILAFQAEYRAFLLDLLQEIIAAKVNNCVLENQLKKNSKST